jgi:effector-binding domain-containing protein
MTGYVVKIQAVPSTPLAVIRRTASQSEFSQVVPKLCGDVWNALRTQGVRGGRNVAVYLDTTFRIEVGAEATAPFADLGEMVHSATPAGRVATCAHFGPYSGLGAAHEAVQQWCRANGHELAGPAWELYGHWRDEWNDNPALIRTDINYLLK